MRLGYLKNYFHIHYFLAFDCNGLVYSSTLSYVHKNFSLYFHDDFLIIFPSIASFSNNAYFLDLCRAKKMFGS